MHFTQSSLRPKPNIFAPIAISPSSRAEMQHLCRNVLKKLSHLEAEVVRELEHEENRATIHG